MSRQRTDENPFDLVKASDFSTTEILNYWVDISSGPGGLVSILQPRLITPMLLLGGKGSGKTHLMRYCSAPVQAARYDYSLRKAVAEEGYLGVYIPAEGLNSPKFSGKGQPDERWLAVFSMYFELWLATNFLSCLRDWVRDGDSAAFNEVDFIADIAERFDVDVSGCFDSLDTVLEYISKLRKQVDYAVNNVALSGTLEEIIIKFSPGRLVYGLPMAAASSAPLLKDVVFVYLVDEVENFTDQQQRFLNSLIRYRSGNATIKLGARLYGIKTYQTLGSGEPIKRGSEYERVELDGFLRDHESEYAVFVEKLIQKRLSRSRFAFLGQGDNLGYLFEELDRANFYQKPTLAALESRDKNGAERPYFKKLRGHIQQAFDVPDEWASALIADLRLPDYPLLEKVNILLLYRRWGKNKSEMSRNVGEIAALASKFLEGGKDSAPEYWQVIDHFDSDLLAQLYRDCQKRVPYAGLDTLVHVSQGIPRNLLGVLKQIYRRSSFADEKPFDGGRISVESQSVGIMDSAGWFWEDAQPDSFGLEVRESIESLALLFRTIRYSEKPAECDLSTFSVASDRLTTNAQNMLNMAENWSYLIRVKAGAKNKNNQQVDAKFQIAPMLAARWGLSIHRRGSIELSSELANAIFDGEFREKLPHLFKARVGGMLASGIFSESSHQKSFL